jgi:hypothetical protein
MHRINRNFFFSQARLSLFLGKLAQPQVDGHAAILDHWEARHADRDDRWLAYILGTAHHETDRKMQPIREYGGNGYFTRMYDPPPSGQRPQVARSLGNTAAGDGCRFCGRGFVQLTGRRNYAKWSERLGVDMVADPLLAMNLAHATAILIEGSIDGSFTGKKLSDYFNKQREDWVQARRIINGLDRAQLIADHAKRYYAAIAYTD